jgi:hypothetical protein
VLKSSHLFSQLLILLFGFEIHLLDPRHLLLKAKEMEDSLISEEGKEPQNQKEEKN